MLRLTLEGLVRQTIASDDFEVIVADDGSSDATAEVARSFTARLPLSYHFQEDLGFRVAEARNAGARLASGAVLVFLDTGALVGRGFVESHLNAHTRGSARSRAIIGYVYGYHRSGPDPVLAEKIIQLAPDEALERYGEEPWFRDMRHPAFAKVDFDLSRLAVPCEFFWTANCSILVSEFWAAGGFDEAFRGWGMEDVDLGFRLFRRGVPFAVSREAWAIEVPHERDENGNLESILNNAQLFLRKYDYCEPLLELTWLMVSGAPGVVLEDSYRAVLDWADESRDTDVAAELEHLARGIPDGARVAVFGSGGVMPSSLPPCVVLDFDPHLLSAAAAGGRHEAHHNIGIRTPLADQSVDIVMITSRLRGPWERWGSQILGEAHRIGREVRGLGQA